MSELWDDLGPVSQGKIITAILKGDKEKAAVMLSRWTHKDLRILERAAAELAAMADQERRRRRSHCS